MENETNERIYDIIREAHTEHIKTIRKNVGIDQILSRLYEAVHEKKPDNIIQFSASLDIALGCNIARVVESEINLKQE